MGSEMDPRTALSSTSGRSIPYVGAPRAAIMRRQPGAATCRSQKFSARVDVDTGIDARPRGTRPWPRGYSIGSPSVPPLPAHPHPFGARAAGPDSCSFLS